MNPKKDFNIILYNRIIIISGNNSSLFISINGVNAVLLSEFVNSLIKAVTAWSSLVRIGFIVWGTRRAKLLI
jgi:hypothetical protein